MTKIYKRHETSDNDIINESIKTLTEGSDFLLIPTETVYGFACSWKNEDAKENIYSAKKRPENKPFQMLASNLDMVEQSGAIISNTVKRITDSFCPGAITIVVPTTDNSTIGFRIPDMKFLRNLIETLGHPLASTSANISGETPALNCQQGLEKLELTPAIAIDAGELPKSSKPSTVIKVNGTEIQVLREGPISIADIKSVI